MNTLPSPKPSRRRRLALRFAVLVAAVSVLGAVYWFTRPPELIWWTSPEIGMTRLHLRMLIPNGWEVEPGWGKGVKLVALWVNSYELSASENEPRIVRWLVGRG